jgi:putative redox protein
MEEIDVQLRFGRAFKGELIAKRGGIPIGREEGDLAPYDMMLGALGACYYSTFVGIADKMRLVYEQATIDIHGVKRDVVPTTLKEVRMVLTILGAPEEKGFARAAELAAKHCSVHETISKVAQIDLTVIFT